MDAIDPIAYVRATPPFHALSGPLFDAAMAALEIAFYPAGTWLVRAGGKPLEHLSIIRKGAVRLEREGQSIQVLEDGETFGYTSLLTREATLDAVVEEDLLSYELPDAEFQRLRSADPAFAGHFAAGLAERLEKALEHSPVVSFQPDLSQEVQRLVRRGAVWVGASATVGEAARIMRAERVSSVLVRTEPPGIVTDRDFTGRVLAEGLGPDAPLARILSRPLRTIPAEAPLHEAWSALLETGVHHLPVERRGEIVGVVTATDLLKSSAQGPMAVLRRVERLVDRGSLPGYAEKVAEMAAALLAAGLDAPAIAALVARLDDALVARLLAWAEADLGPAPASYAWIALGAEGRREQAVLTELDLVLAYADGAEGSGTPAVRSDGEGGYWEALMGRVAADLVAAGFPPPRARPARTTQAPLAEWRRRVDACVDDRRPHAAELLFDFRKVAGPLDVATLEAAAGRAARNPAFLRFLARAATDRHPPSRVTSASHVDLEAGGILPVVHLARCYGLEVGTTARATLDRLAAARDAGLVSAGAHDAVAQAYRFLLGLALRHRLRRLAERRPPTAELPVGELSAIERTRLKESFRAIRRWQEKAAYHYRTDFF
ncbi:MAG TPA: putative nucleotidyltransferase substrate binding domain-containing protein [Anaeromyxobacter sp.]|nr:putative nucleotidyltransferase substrate binding domain-containing protein [Anaeromyxobacter sp.]